MMLSNANVERIIVVGGGLAGLATATQLAQAGYPVTVLESSVLGTAASTQNQGWLYSGASFARKNSDLAKRCYQSLLKTLSYCPECIEPDVGHMIYGSLEKTSDFQQWTDAWKEAGIPYGSLSEGELRWDLPQVNPANLTWSARLPDRSFRPHVLLDALANTARASGVEIRPGTFASNLLIDERQVYGVRIGANEDVRAKLVILAIGTASGKRFSPLFGNIPGQQEDYELAYVKTHLLAISPALNIDSFCLTGRESFNHIPHSDFSVFGTDRWLVAQDPNDRTVNHAEFQIIEKRVSRLLPGALDDMQVRKTWAGVTVQAMHLDEVDPAQAFRPTIVDHATQPNGIENVLSVFPGRATLWSELAEMVESTVTRKMKRAAITTTVPPWNSCD